MSPHNHRISLTESQHHVVDPTNPRRALNDGVEHRRHVRRRAAEYAEHLRGSRLVLYSFAKLSLAGGKQFSSPLQLFLKSVQLGCQRAFFLFYDVNATQSNLLSTTTETPLRLTTNLHRKDMECKEEWSDSSSAIRDVKP